MDVKLTIFSIILIGCACSSWIVYGMEDEELLINPDGPYILHTLESGSPMLCVRADSPEPCTRIKSVCSPACISALMALRKIPARPGTPTSTLQETWLDTLINAAISNDGPTVELNFGSWFARVLGQVRNDAARREKIKVSLLALAERITAIKKVTRVSIKPLSVDDSPLVFPMIELLTKRIPSLPVEIIYVTA